MPAGVPIHACLAEFVGTFLLVFTIGCNVLGRNGAWGAASIGCGLMVLIYALVNVSGGHFNPAVTLVLAIARKIDHLGGWLCVLAYSFSQICGGLLGALAYSVLFRQGFAVAPKPGYLGGAAACEFLYTTMLCFVFLNCLASKAKGGANQYFGLAVGFVIIAGAYGSGALGAGCFNPAVTISLYTASVFTTPAPQVLTCVFFVCAEIAGAVFAMVLFGFVRPEERDRNDTLKGSRSYGMGVRLLAEFIGTYLLVFTVGLNVLGGSPAAALSIAAVYICMIFAVGDVSGGHFNPAVTVAIQLAGKGKGAADMGFYILVQTIAGMLGAATYAIVHKGDTFPLGPGVGHDWTAVAVAEILFTFVLTFVVLGVSSVKGKPAAEFTGLIVGATVIAGGFAVGAVSGGCLNPAIAMGVAAAHIINGGMFLKALLYVTFQLVGAGCAALTFRVLYMEEAADSMDEKEEEL